MLVCCPYLLQQVKIIVAFDYVRPVHLQSEIADILQDSIENLDCVVEEMLCYQFYFSKNDKKVQINPYMIKLICLLNRTSMKMTSIFGPTMTKLKIMKVLRLIKNNMLKRFPVIKLVHLMSQTEWKSSGH